MSYPFRVLEVQTLHVRDLKGEKRVQALGLFQDYGICSDCAKRKLEQIRKPGSELWKRLIPFGLIFIIGVVLAVVFWKGEGALRLLGLAGIVSGIMGLVSISRGFSKRQKEYAGLTDSEALNRAAWECLVEFAPKKDGENDLTYIPVNDRTLKMKNGDLMIEYDLLPEIAIKAHKLIHGKTD